MIRPVHMLGMFLGLIFLTCIVFKQHQNIELMQGDGLEVVSIGMDHNAMLAENPKENKAFQRVFGAFLGQSRAHLARETELAYRGVKVAKAIKSLAKKKHLNRALATRIQAKLTANAEDLDGGGVVTPHFVAALEAVGHSDDDQSASESALTHGMQTSGVSSLVQSKSQSKPESAEQADDELLTAVRKAKHSVDFVRKAAMMQMKKLSTPAYTQQLAQPSMGQIQYVYPQQQRHMQPVQYRYPAEALYSPGAYETPEGYYGPEQAQSAQNHGQVPYSGVARLSGYQAPASRSPEYASPQSSKPQARYQTPQQAALAQMQKLGLGQ